MTPLLLGKERTMERKKFHTIVNVPPGGITSRKKHKESRRGSKKDSK